MSMTRRPATCARDPLVDDEVALEPVVLLGHVGQRALAVERERRDAGRLVALDVEARSRAALPCTRSARRRDARSRAPRPARAGTSVIVRRRTARLADRLERARDSRIVLQHDLHLELRERRADAAPHAAAERDPRVRPGR